MPSRPIFCECYVLPVARCVLAAEHATPNTQREVVPPAGAAPTPDVWKTPALLLRHSGKGMVPSAGHDPATLRLRVACATHLRHDGIVGAAGGTRHPQLDA